jgi:hypothetical protein
MEKTDSILRWLGRALLFGLGAGFLLNGVGCAALPLATVGTVSGIAGTAISAAPEVYSAGKLDTALRARADDCQQAVRQAAEDLGLRIVRDRPLRGERQRWEIELQDERASDIDVTVERRASMLCLCQVDVGLFGSEPTAKLVMQTIGSHLRTMAAEVTTREAG